LWRTRKLEFSKTKKLAPAEFLTNLSFAKMIFGANAFRISVTSSIRANPQGQNAAMLHALRQAK
jgi:hypothetical protein